MEPARLQVLYNFIRSKKITPEQNKVLVNTKLLFIFNDQMHRFINRSQEDNFLEFLYKNALEKNSNDVAKITDFFSRILNTVINLSKTVYEIKCLVLVMSEKINQRPAIRRYLDVRETLMVFKGEDPSLKNQVSTLSLREIELFSIYKYFGINSNEFNQFLKNEGLNTAPGSLISLDVVIFYLLTKQSSVTFDFAVKDEKKMRRFINGNALQRVFTKVRCVCRLLVLIRKNKKNNQLHYYSKMTEDMKHCLKEKTYFRQQLIDTFKKSFIESYQSPEVFSLSKINEEFDRLVHEEKKGFYVFLSKKIISTKNNIELSKHLIQLLHLKQMADLKKYSKEVEDASAKDKGESVDLSKLRAFAKDFYLFEFVKRESIEGLKKQISDRWDEIVREKFVKDEVFDKDVIVFIKKIESSLADKLKEMVQRRDKEIDETIDQIKHTSFMDELIILLKRNLNQIKSSASLQAVLSNLMIGGANIKGLAHSKIGLQNSKILNRTQLGKSALEQKGVNLCVKCRAIIDAPLEIGDEKIAKEQAVQKLNNDEDVIDAEDQMNKSILNYVHRKKMNLSKIDIEEARRNSLAHRRELLMKLKAEDEQKDLTTQVQPIQNDFIPPAPMIDVGPINRQIPPAPIIDMPKNIPKPPANDMELRNNNQPSTLPEKNDIPPAPIIQKNNKNEVPPPPLINFNPKIPPAPIINFGPKIPPAPAISFDNRISPSPVINIGPTIPPAPLINIDPKIPPAPILSINRNNIPPPPILSNQNEIPPPPIINLKNEIPPPPILNIKNEIPPPSILNMKNEIPPPPILKMTNNIPPPPLLSANNQIPPPQIINLNTNTIIPPPPMLSPNKGVNTMLPLPPILSNANTEGLPPPAPFITMGLQSPTTNTFTSFNNYTGVHPMFANQKIQTQFKLPEIALPKDVKMKPLFWDKLEPNQLSTTIWMHIHNHSVPVKIEKMIEYFQDVRIIKKIQEDLQSTRPQKIDLIGDDTRKNILNIALTKLFKINKLSWEETMQMILEINENKIGLEAFLLLRKLAPTSVEVEMARNYKDSMDNLEIASRWLCEVIIIPRFEQRFDGLALINEFNRDYNNYKDFLDNFFSACEILQDDRNFQKFLRLAIDAGNIMNIGTRRGNAYGFRIVSLIEFFSCKSSVKIGLSLMEYIMFEIHVQNPTILNFVEGLAKKLKMAISRNIEDVVDETMELKRRFAVLQNHLESAEKSKPPDSFFILKFEKFMAENGEKIVTLEEELLKTKEFYFETMLFLGEPERKLKDKKSKEMLMVYYNTFNQMLGCIEKFKK